MVLASYRTSLDMMKRGISETVISWLFIDWKSAVALKTPICPHVRVFPPAVLFWQSHGIHNGQGWWRGIHLICTFSQRLFSWFITKAKVTHWRRDRLHLWRYCVLHHASRKTWFFVHMAFNVCQCLYDSLSVL